MNFTFDEQLRELPENEEEMHKGVQFLKQQLQNTNITIKQKAKYMGNIGAYLRVLRKYEEGKQYLTEAIRILRELNDDVSIFVNKLRLAHIYQWEHEFDIANKMFEQCVKLAQSEQIYEAYKDFTYQHYGKCLYDQCRFTVALVYFEKALSIREDKANESLLASSQKAVDVCKEKIITSRSLN